METTQKPSIELNSVFSLPSLQKLCHQFQQPEKFIKVLPTWLGTQKTLPSYQRRQGSLAHLDMVATGRRADKTFIGVVKVQCLRSLGSRSGINDIDLLPHGLAKIATDQSRICAVYLLVKMWAYEMNCCIIWAYGLLHCSWSDIQARQLSAIK